MKFNTKNYKIDKTKNYIETNDILFFFNGVNKKSNDWIHTEQNLKKINFKYYKIFNKTTKKELNNSSINNNLSNIINGITFLLTPEQNTKNLLKNIILKDLTFLFFVLLTVKLNNKLYSVNQLKQSNSLNYINNKLLIYQFSIVHLKRFNSLNLSK